MASDTTTWRDDVVASAIHNAFCLGHDLVELRSRIQLAQGAVIPGGGPPPLLATPDSLWMASQWRATWNRIISMHAKLFPDSVTADTLYHPPDKTQIPYLYPPSPDYTNIGIRIRGDLLQNFGLCEVTRRAINCLTLLYVDPALSMIKGDLERYQARIVHDVLANASEPWAPPAGKAAGPPPLAVTARAIHVLTEELVGFLEAWDGYLRENLFTGGRLPDDAGELDAYEAGRALASLSWGISVKTLPMIAAGAKGGSLVEVWKVMFQEREVTALQHRVGALGGALDEAWYHAHPDRKRPMDTLEASAPDPELPSECLRAVRHGLEYWRRTVLWLDKGGRFTPELAEQLRLALIAQSGIWHSLVLGKQTLSTFTVESVTHQIMNNFVAEMQKAAGGAIVSTGTAEIEQLAAHSQQALKDLLGASLWTLSGVALVIMLILGAVLTVHHFSPETFGWVPTGISSIGGVFTAWLFGQRSMQRIKSIVEVQLRATVDKARTTAAGRSAIGVITSLASTATSSLESAFEKGYAQLRVELASLNHYVSTTYPLVELMVTHADTLAVKGSYEFLTTVIWSDSERKENLEHITFAAFGPIAAFVKATSADGARRGEAIGPRAG
jgi:hypothetical protein